MPGGGEPCDLPVLGLVCSSVGSAVQSGFQQFLDWMDAGLGKVLVLMTSGWLKVATPGVAPLPGSGVGSTPSANGATDTAAWLQDHVTWLSSWLAAVCLVVAGARMAYQMRGMADLRVILEGLVRLVLVNGIVIAGVFIATQIGDSYSNWIITQSLGDNAGQKLGAVTGNIAELTAGFGGLAVPMILVGAALVSSLLNLVIGFFRAAVLVVLAGTISIPASTALTDMGRRWLARWLAWMLGFICVKPAAATIYATAYRLNGNAHQDLSSGVAGLALLAGAIVVLPALLRLFQPAGMALAGGSGLAGSEHGGGSQATGSRAPSGAVSSGGQASGGAGASGGPSGASSSGGRAGLTSGQSSGISSAGQAARSGATAGAASQAGRSGGGGAGGGGGGKASGSSGGGGSGMAAAAAMKAGSHAKQQLVDGLREGAQGLDRELGDGPSGS